MMSFNPAFNPALLSTSQPTTPIKSDSSSTVPPTTPSGPGPEELLRLIAAAQSGSSPSNGGPPAGFPAGLFPFGGGAPGGLPFPFMMNNEMKPDMMGGAPGGGPMMPFLDFNGFHPYAMVDGVRRKNATRETTAPLKEWLNAHRKNPYPNKHEKVMLAILTKMTLTQVSTWFANARRRLKKENKMTWSPRNRPGEDDDDLADLERPGSSKSDLSDDHNESNNNDNNKSPEPSVSDESSPRKAKIWSIADTVGVKDDDEDKKESSPSSSTNSDSNNAAALAMAWQQQQQQMAMMARLMNGSFPQALQGIFGGGPMVGHPAAAAAPNPALLNQLLMAGMMQARMAANVQPGNGMMNGIPISSLSPSSSTHSDNDKPPTLVDATVSPSENGVKKESTPETPDSN